ncbi:MAG: biopolymer transporter ExbD, partial [Hydrocarboniphaga effusa]|nr:biopolymer transporter ExbD [Hydrocarboniphaga effusa]
YLNVGENQKDPLSDEEVVNRIGAIIRPNPDKLILIHGDAAVPYQRVAQGMALLQQAGARKVGFITEPREGAPAR